jgi:hypothetical protein
MFKIVSYNSCLKNIIACFVLVWFSTTAKAQVDEEAPPVTFDSSYSTVDTVTITTTDAEIPKFDSLTPGPSPSYHPYTISGNKLNDLRKDDAFWYANETPKRQKPPEVKQGPTPFFLQNWFRTLLWVVIIGAFLAVLIWFLIASDVRLFRKKPRVLDEETDIALSEDIFAINYEQELQKAVSNNNYRLGVRLMYLHILKIFSDNGIIQYKIERTNSDYLAQLYNTSYYKNFFRLTRNFEYVWYGKFDIPSEAFQMVQQDYTNLKARL